MPGSLGGLLLAEWIDANSHSQEWVAKCVGVAQTTVGGWIGGTAPKVPVAIALESLTGIPVRAWADPVPAKRSLRAG